MNTHTPETQPKGEITEITGKVKELLTTDPKAHLYRDSDPLLTNRIHYDELVAMGYADPLAVTMKTFFELRRKQSLTSEHSISRARRKVQELDPSARGEKYKVRQSRQIDVIDELKGITLASAAQKEKCYKCEGTGKYEGFACNICNGTGFETEE